jgi:hypothetical protein
MLNTEAINALRTYRQTVLVGPDAIRSRALEIRAEAKRQGMDVAFKTDVRGRVIELKVR